MILADLRDGEAVLLDANILVYHFAPHPILGPACNDLVRRIESQALLGYTSTAVLSDVAHHLMTFESRFELLGLITHHLLSGTCGMGIRSLFSPVFVPCRARPAALAFRGA